MRCLALAHLRYGRFREAYKYSMRGVSSASREDRPAWLVALYNTAVQALVSGALGPTFTLQQVDQLLAAHAAALARCIAWMPSARRKIHLYVGTGFKGDLGIPAGWASNWCDCLQYFLRPGRDTMPFNIHLADMQADSRKNKGWNVFMDS